MLYALDVGPDIVGVTAGCDYPPDARTKPVVVETVLAPDLAAEDIDRIVAEHAARGDSVYRVESQRLAALQPDLIVTQALCNVCAVTPSHLVQTLAGLSPPPVVLELTPHTLADVLDDIRRVGQATGRAEKAAALAHTLRARIEHVRARPKVRRPIVVCLEWLAPPFSAGHWVPEMVAIAGGTDALGQCGADSVRITWDAVVAANPDVVLVMPCGYTMADAARAYDAMPKPAGWSDVPAVRRGEVYALDATSYFSRPGPRLVAGLEMLAAILQGDDLGSSPVAGGCRRV